MKGLDFSKTPKFTLSANEIRQYCECPRKRYYASRDCLAVRTNVKNKNLELGRAVHLAFAYYYTELDKKLKELNNNAPDLDTCLSLLETIPVFNLLPAEEGGATLDLADKQIYNCILESYKAQIALDLVDYSIIECEMAFNMDNWPIDNVRYHGNIDMVVEKRSDGTIWFFEHKTCRDFRPEIYDRFDIQLHIYAAYGKMQYNEKFGGMLLNELKKAKTVRGYGLLRVPFSYSDEEYEDFYIWLKAKTQGVVVDTNMHEPCNNYMSCKMCEYGPICMKFGYQVPKTTKEIILDDTLIIEEVNEETGEVNKKPMFMYDPREPHDEAE